MSRCAGEPGGARSDVAGVESRLTCNLCLLGWLQSP